MLYDFTINFKLDLFPSGKTVYSQIINYVKYLAFFFPKHLMISVNNNLL